MSATAANPVLATRPCLQVDQLRVALGDGQDVVADISFSIEPGEILGLVGESGSGKTTIATALLAHVRSGARIETGRVLIDGQDILALSPAALQSARGKLVSYVPQDPATALNPLQRIGGLLTEILKAHEPQLDTDSRTQRALQVLDDVGLPADREFLRRFPHQLSGGQQQRIVLALAFVLRPTLIVLDEPTTALDVTTQARILDTIRRLCGRYGVAAIYVSHDLAIVKQLADRVIVLYAGRIVETATNRLLFSRPAHPYTQGLLAAIPDISRQYLPRPIPGRAPAPGSRPAGCAFSPRCQQALAICQTAQPGLTDLSHAQQAACFHLGAAQRPVTEGRKIFSLREASAIQAPPPLVVARNIRADYGQRQVLFGVDLVLRAGQCEALVGESGSGKTTLARVLAGASGQVVGELSYQGMPLAPAARHRRADIRRQIQYVFQNPYRSLNPRHTIGQTLVTALRHFFPLDHHQARQRAAIALERVSLSPELLDVYPDQLSGGERQRVAIARALVCEPSVLICDEITSALDVSVQATIIELLRELQTSGLAILFVTHNLSLVRAMADHVTVLKAGQVIEHGPVDTVFTQPSHAYTQQLIDNTPGL